MTWLTPLTGLILAAAVIPPLILLYFLKLRRRTQPIASTLLWKRSVEDLRANAPFQRLRRSLLLLLQLMVLALLAFAVMQPQLQAGHASGGKTVMLIDTSASMTATDGLDPSGEPSVTRLEQAKRGARERIEQMFGGSMFTGSDAGEVMVISFSDHAEIHSRFTGSKQQLLNAVDSIQPTHGRSKIAEALKLARAYTVNVDPDNPRPVGAPAALELFSDGRIEDLSEQVLRGERMIYHPVGTPASASTSAGAPGSDNVAIGAIAVERPYDQPTSIQVFVGLLNFNREPTNCALQLSINGDVLLGGVQDLAIDAATVDPSNGRLVPGRYNLTFKPFEQPRDAVIEVRNLRQDKLEADNVARIVVPPAKQLRVALVNSRSFVLKTALEGLPLERITALSGEQFNELAAASGLDQFDVIVLDNFAPAALPPGNYLSFGALPPAPGLIDAGPKDERQMFLQYRQDHATLRFVNLDNVIFDRARLVVPGEDVIVLAEASSGAPAIIEVMRGPLRLIAFTFDLLDSTFPVDRHFPTFIYNAIDYLGHSGESLAMQARAPGEALTASLPAAATEIEIELPDGTKEPIPASDPQMVSWGPARLSGTYTLRWSLPDGSRPSQLFAVNIPAEQEGDIAPAPQVTLSEDRVEGASADDSAYTALWPWAVAACLAILMLEWWIYHRKTFV